MLSTSGLRVEFVVENELETPIIEIIEYTDTGSTITLLFKDMFINRYETVK